MKYQKREPRNSIHQILGPHFSTFYLRYTKKDVLVDPVVSSVKCHIEKISAFVDEKLRPIVSKLKSYIKDTSDFLRKIKDIGEIPKDAILVTMDVTGLYTNIDNTEGLEAMREALEESSQNQKPSANALTLMMRLILMLNNFVFNNVN